MMSQSPPADALSEFDRILDFVSNHRRPTGADAFVVVGQNLEFRPGFVLVAQGPGDLRAEVP
jgi:hypothetical protein